MAMTKLDLFKASAIARRFLAEAEALDKLNSLYNGVYVDQPAEQAAVRRASMDLTRALAKLRKGKAAHAHHQ